MSSGTGFRKNGKRDSSMPTYRDNDNTKTVKEYFQLTKKKKIPQ